MKMSRKMILLFSFLALLTTIANAMYFYQSKMDDLDRQTYEHLNALGTKMLSETEKLVQLMDYAIESLYANTDFMSAMHIASTQDDASDLGEILRVQTNLSSTLYQEPILENFFRVCVYSRNGLYLSSRFEKTDSLVNMSDEVLETINALDYLEQVDCMRFHRILVGPHNDPWTQTRDVPVFSAVKAVTYHSHPVGYIEVNAHIDDLSSIFFLEDMEGFMAQAILDNGEELFRYHGDDVVYNNLNASGMTHVELPDGSERLVVALHSDTLQLTVYVSQDMTVYNRQANELLLRNLAVALSLFCITLVLVVAFSLELTSSTRKLTRKVRSLSAEQLLADSGQAVTTMVVKPKDQEIFELEQVFNDLMNRLHQSAQNEIIMREGALQARLSALQMQINPHFIYNTLNIISAKGMESGNEEITDICDQFAQMLRYATDLSSQTATLGEEIQNAQRYLMLAKARFEDHLVYEIDVPEEMNHILLPKLSLQPIVENALSHGFSGRTDRREIRLTGTLENKQLRLTIHDNGNGFNPEMLRRLRNAFHQIEEETLTGPGPTGEHLGLINTYLRLHHYSKGQIRMQLYNEDGAAVVLIMPQEEHHV